jgi:5,6-dimethylbenzimidazole synthase
LIVLPTSNAAPEFDPAFRAKLRALFAARRDVRRFKTDPLPPGTLERLIDAACSAPSVGLSQPWRFVIVDTSERRAEIGAVFRACNAEALAAQSGAAAAAYARLKLAGLDEAPCHLAVFADRETPVGRGLGRRTMPEMADYSAVTAIYTLWLLARAEGIGMGWVSILDPLRMAGILDVASDWRFIGYFCLGYPLAESDTPELEREGWERRRPSAEFLLRR